MKVPEVEKCCCCFPLRQGIIVIGVLNILFSLVAVTCLVITTELKKATIFEPSSLEVVTATILFSIFGMAVILNIMLLVAGCQKDIAMLRLYLFYGVATILAALVPTFVLMSRNMMYDAAIALSAIIFQWYVIVVVRSELIKLERAELIQQVRHEHDVVIEVADTEMLL